MFNEEGHSLLFQVEFYDISNSDNSNVSIQFYLSIAINLGSKIDVSLIFHYNIKVSSFPSNKYQLS